MYKVLKIHCDKTDLKASRKQREVAFSGKYSLLLLVPKGVDRADSPAPLRRSSRQNTLVLPVKNLQRSRSLSPSLQLMTNYVYKVVDWFSSVDLKDLSDNYNVVLREYASSRSSTVAGETVSAVVNKTTAEDQVFLIYNGNDGELAKDAFVNTLSALKLLLSGVSSPLHEEFVKDLFDHHGPVQLEDFPKKVITWNQAGPGSQIEIGLDTQYEDGLSALHVACESGQEDVVQQLLQLGANANVTDIDGNTAYHLAVTSGHGKCLKVLLDNDLQFLGSQQLVKRLSLQNCDGHTPLMLAASSNHVPIALQLLCADADVTATSKITGDTALHIAARKGYLDMTRLLTVFDAPAGARNKSNETPLSAAETSKKHGATECAENLGALVEGSPYPDEVLVADYPVDGPVLLSLDGGGIRGQLEVTVLNELESMLIAMDPNFKSLTDYFDWMIGTSTGSFVSIGLAYQRLRPRRIRCIYFEMTEEMKKLSPPYPDEGYNKIMKSLFLENMVLSDITTPKVAITTTLADRTPPELHLMCNYGEARQGQKGPSKRKLWEAARASTAAPTYFEAFENKFIDGGVVSNNPTLDGMTEMVMLQSAEGKPTKLGMVVSLGAGVMASSSIGKINIRQGVSNLLQNLKGYAGIMKVIVAQVTHSDGQVVDHARAWCRNTNCPFFRFSAPISEIDMTESDTGKIAKMMFQGLIYVKRNKDRIKRLAELLIKHRSV